MGVADRLLMPERARNMVFGGRREIKVKRVGVIGVSCVDKLVSVTLTLAADEYFV